MMPATIHCQQCGEHVECSDYLAERGVFFEAHSGPFDAVVILPAMLRPIDITITIAFGASG